MTDYQWEADLDDLAVEDPDALLSKIMSTSNTTILARACFSAVLANKHAGLAKKLCLLALESPCVGVRENCIRALRRFTIFPQATLTLRKVSVADKSPVIRELATRALLAHAKA